MNDKCKCERVDIAKILRQLCEREGVNQAEYEVKKSTGSEIEEAIWVHYAEDNEKQLFKIGVKTCINLFRLGENND